MRRNSRQLEFNTMSEGIINATEASFDTIIKAPGTPVVVDFWAPWCGPCRSIAPILEQLAAELGDAAKVVKVNVDDNQGLAGKYGIRAIPTLLLFKDGQVKDQIVGLIQKDALKAKLLAL
jgi:thioredoxin 1